MKKTTALLLIFLLTAFKLQTNFLAEQKKFTQIGPFSFKNKSEIKNLYLCGASTLSHGVGGASHSGVEAAAQMLNVKSEELMVDNENQKLRIYDAENYDAFPEFIKQKIEDRKRRFKETTTIQVD